MVLSACSNVFLTVDVVSTKTVSRTWGSVSGLERSALSIFSAKTWSRASVLLTFPNRTGPSL